MRPTVLPIPRPSASSAGNRATRVGARVSAAGSAIRRIRPRIAVFARPRDEPAYQTICEKMRKPQAGLRQRRSNSGGLVIDLDRLDPAIALLAPYIDLDEIRPKSLPECNHSFRGQMARKPTVRAPTDAQAASYLRYRVGPHRAPAWRRPACRFSALQTGRCVPAELSQ